MTDTKIESLSDSIGTMGWWYGYECHECHVLTDVGFERQQDQEPKMPCPVCGQAMSFADCWPATYTGHGSRGDGSHRQLHERIRELEVEVSRLRGAHR